MDIQQNIIIFLGTIILLFVILLGLITLNILKHRQIYSFRSEDRVWDHWKSQVFGLIFFNIGFVAFTFVFFGYVFLVHPEFFGMGINLMMFINNPFKYFYIIILALIGFGVSIIGLIINLNAISQFISKIKSSKGENA
ncbi:MAG: hypothetical protein ACTSO9_05365 [Candidatus Helarchaeota archaeon]